ncbi:SDR family NAD(P)-dependent oxidoreductase [Amycolatopsis sp. QT-25]|uniref:SDR family NAD(P)-dependent oxidoreductase n=1 Tax=Amycolatopsis sp. QT-25 TaxID=3034022 RepID=UPI0023ECF976|nr:SDR family NAD(P)-dependent oxidoreductase [Amycolatopsis sp. QT-25]WET82989.1 SDR family NAD(P)-dependent oxidoreductase [Amycolatopsis sp. QT-25]
MERDTSTSCSAQRARKSALAPDNRSTSRRTLGSFWVAGGSRAQVGDGLPGEPGGAIGVVAVPRDRVGEEPPDHVAFHCRHRAEVDDQRCRHRIPRQHVVNCVTHHRRRVVQPVEQVQNAGPHLPDRAGQRPGNLSDQVVQIGQFVGGQSQCPADRGDHLPRRPRSLALFSPTDLPVDNLREVYETNVFGVVAVTNAMLPLLRRSPAGYIGNVSSGLGTVAFLTDRDSPLWQFANLLACNSSKAALNAVTLIYANTSRDSGIRVNALSPGYCATDLNNHSGHLTAHEGGAHIAHQATIPDHNTTGVFLNENGGTYPW